MHWRERERVSDNVRRCGMIRIIGLNIRSKWKKRIHKIYRNKWIRRNEQNQRVIKSVASLFIRFLFFSFFHSLINGAQIIRWFYYVLDYRSGCQVKCVHYTYVTTHPTRLRIHLSPHKRAIFQAPPTCRIDSRFISGNVYTFPEMSFAFIPVSNFHLLSHSTPLTVAVSFSLLCRVHALLFAQWNWNWKRLVFRGTNRIVIRLDCLLSTLQWFIVHLLLRITSTFRIVESSIQLENFFHVPLSLSRSRSLPSSGFLLLLLLLLVVVWSMWMVSKVLPALASQFFSLFLFLYCQKLDKRASVVVHNKFIMEWIKTKHFWSILFRLWCMRSSSRYMYSENSSLTFISANFCTATHSYSPPAHFQSWA